MNPITFPEANIIVAEDQEEYLPLPAFRTMNDMGMIISCWQLSPEEIEIVKQTGHIWLTNCTFNEDLQPVMMSVHKPIMNQ